MTNPIELLRGTPYVQAQAVARDNIDGRAIYKFSLPEQDIARVTEAADAVLVLQRRYYCTFQTQSREDLERLVSQNRHLTFNGNSVSLAIESGAAEHTPIGHTDQYFSGTRLEEPVKCSQGHAFERQRVQVWASENRGACPLGGHFIENFNIDPVLQDEIRQHEANHQREQAAAAAARDQERINAANQALKEGCSGVGSGVVTGVKIVAKTSQFVAIGVMKKFGAILMTGGVRPTVNAWAARKLAVVVLLKAPFISLGIGACTALYRLSQRQYVRALVEVASAVLGGVPVCGTVAAITLDTTMAIYDRRQAK